MSFCGWKQAYGCESEVDVLAEVYLFVVFVSLLLKFLLQGSDGGLESDFSLCKTLLHLIHLLSQVLNFTILQKQQPSKSSTVNKRTNFCFSSLFTAIYSAFHVCALCLRFKIGGSKIPDINDSVTCIQKP